MRDFTNTLVESMIIGVIVGTVTFLISIAILFPIYFIIKGSFDSSGWIFIVSACIGWFFFVASAIISLITGL
jgi:hypothetical protein